jgi:hypothetical protein
VGAGRRRLVSHYGLTPWSSARPLDKVATRFGMMMLIDGVPTGNIQPRMTTGAFDF